jgi:hypothetical protein
LAIALAELGEAPLMNNLREKRDSVSSINASSLYDECGFMLTFLPEQYLSQQVLFPHWKDRQ